MSKMTEKERQAIEKAADVYTNNTWKYAPEENKESFIAGAEKLAELRNAEKPSEELVKEIEDVIFKVIDTEGKSFDVLVGLAANEIAKLVTQMEAELLEAAKDALTTFYGIGCTDEADIVQALKKAISNYKIH